jgi:hypothetical protein
MAQRHLFPDIRWTTFREGYLRSTEQYDDKDPRFYEDDYTGDVMTSEVSTVLQVLDSYHLKEFLYFDDTKEVYRCPKCLEGRSKHSDDECEFVQLTRPDSLQCVVCPSNYSVADYKQAIIDYFGYLDPKDQEKIKKEMDENF